MPLSTVILQARNQSTHYEEAIGAGTFRNPAINNCFLTLKSEQDEIFDEYSRRDMSHEVLKMLDWTSYENYERDMLSFC